MSLMPRSGTGVVSVPISKWKTAAKFSAGWSGFPHRGRSPGTTSNVILLLVGRGGVVTGRQDPDGSGTPGNHWLAYPFPLRPPRPRGPEARSGSPAWHRVVIHPSADF